MPASEPAEWRRAVRLRNGCHIFFPGARADAFRRALCSYRPTWFGIPPSGPYVWLVDGYGSSNVYPFTRDGKRSPWPRGPLPAHLYFTLGVLHTNHTGVKPQLHC
jgi:hypothetical protein